MKAACLVVLLCALAACGAPAARNAAVRQAPRAEAPRGERPTGVRAPAKEEEEPLPARPPVASGDAGFHHFFAGREAFEALMRGETDAARAALSRVQQDSEAPGLPAAWQPQLTAVQRAAARAGDAPDAAAVAEVVAEVGALCGACHLEHAGRAVIPEGDTRGYRAAGRVGVTEEMARHQWPAQQLWLGLTSPRERDWARGARGFGEDWPTLSDARGAADLIELGEQLLSARTGGERQHGLARLLTRCIPCHTR